MLTVYIWPDERPAAVSSEIEINCAELAISLSAARKHPLNMVSKSTVWRTSDHALDEKVKYDFARECAE